MSSLDPAFRERFGYSLEEIIFKTPPAVSQTPMSAISAWMFPAVVFMYACVSTPLQRLIRVHAESWGGIWAETTRFNINLLHSIQRRVSVPTCNCWVWLRMCDSTLMTLGASSDSPGETSDAACCSCSSGYAVVEDGHLGAESCLSVRFFRSQWNSLSRRIFQFAIFSIPISRLGCCWRWRWFRLAGSSVWNRLRCQLAGSRVCDPNPTAEPSEGKYSYFIKTLQEFLHRIKCT